MTVTRVRKPWTFAFQRLRGERGRIYAIPIDKQWSHAVAGIDGSIASVEAERNLRSVHFKSENNRPPSQL